MLDKILGSILVYPPFVALSFSFFIIFAKSVRSWVIRTLIALAPVFFQLVYVAVTDFPSGMLFPPLTAIFVMIPSGYWLIVLLARAYPQTRFKPALGLLAMWMPMILFMIWAASWK